MREWKRTHGTWTHSGDTWQDLAPALPQALRSDLNLGQGCKQENWDSEFPTQGREQILPEKLRVTILNNFQQLFPLTSCWMVIKALLAIVAVAREKRSPNIKMLIQV